MVRSQDVRICSVNMVITILTLFVGDSSGGRTEGLTCSEGSSRRDVRVSSHNTATVPTDPEHDRV